MYLVFKDVKMFHTRPHISRMVFLHHRRIPTAEPLTFIILCVMLCYMLINRALADPGRGGAPGARPPNGLNLWFFMPQNAKFPSTFLRSLRSAFILNPFFKIIGQKVSKNWPILQPSTLSMISMILPPPWQSSHPPLRLNPGSATAVGVRQWSYLIHCSPRCPLVSNTRIHWSWSFQNAFEWRRWVHTFYQSHIVKWRTPWYTQALDDAEDQFVSSRTVKDVFDTTLSNRKVSRFWCNDSPACFLDWRYISEYDKRKKKSDKAFI